MFNKVGLIYLPTQFDLCFVQKSRCICYCIFNHKKLITNSEQPNLGHLVLASKLCLIWFSLETEARPPWRIWKPIKVESKIDGLLTNTRYTGFRTLPPSSRKNRGKYLIIIKNIFRFKKNSKINNKIYFPFKQKSGQFPYQSFVD